MIKMPDWNVIYSGLSTEEKTCEIGEALRFAFKWDDWLPGYAYWRSIVNNLQPYGLHIHKSFYLDWNVIFVNASAYKKEERAKVVADALLSAFSWSDTEKGPDYWIQIYNQLNDLTSMDDESVTTKVWWDKSLPKRLP
jgi:hypothetical protein